MPDLSELKRIAEIEFSGIVKSAVIVDYKPESTKYINESVLPLMLASGANSCCVQT
jgi:hypothetical protein